MTYNRLRGLGAAISAKPKAVSPLLITPQSVAQAAALSKALATPAAPAPYRALPSQAKIDADNQARKTAKAGGKK